MNDTEAPTEELVNEQPVERSREPVSRLEVIGQLRAQLTGIMPDAETLWGATAPGAAPPISYTRRVSWGRRGRYASEPPVAFRGHLSIDPQVAYTLLRERFAALGYTPILRNQEGYDVIVALQQVFGTGLKGRLTPRQWVPNLVLLLVTLLTTTLMGAVLELSEQVMANPLLFFQQPSLILSGIPASLTIMSILGIHELGHYFMARRHGLETTLPFFIPVPFGFGTFGAIIRIRTPWENRKALFDVGLAGPLAGLVIAFPLFFLGLMLSPARPPTLDGGTLGSPLLLQWMEQAVYAIRGIPQDYVIYANAMTFAAWFGLVVTGFNLLPVGQLDGGHVSHALLGRYGRVIGLVTLIALAVLGALVWNGWYIWAAFIFLSGWQHPDPLNTVTPLGTKRLIVGIAVLVLTILLFTPSPFSM
jgi:Zn-dependent protease